MAPEMAWFGALCDDDYERLGVVDPGLVSSWDHCRDICLTAEQLGFDNVLLPSGYQLGIDAVAFAAALAPRLSRMRLLLAVRAGELWPPQLARQLATVAHLLGDRRRLTVNIISSDLPGAPLPSEARYARTLEVMQILRPLLAGRPVEHHGEFYDLTLEPPRLVGEPDEAVVPPLYFGGLSEPARRVAAAAADVYLMWPDTLDGVAATVADLRRRAAEAGRELRFGYRVHVIVRETEDAARAAARRLVSCLDDETGAGIRSRSLDTASAGVARQGELRAAADDEGFVEDHLWTGVGRARSGCGAALVGDPDQVSGKLEAYRELGIDTFILSGYPHLDEARHVADLILPRFRE